MERGRLNLVRGAVLATEILLACGIVADIVYDDVTRPDINLSVLPNTLPQPVEQSTQNAVALQAVSAEDQVTGDILDDYSELGSGVRISPNLFVTAGHLINREDGQPLSTSTTCGDLFVASPTTQPQQSRMLGGKLEPLFGASLGSTKATGIFEDDDNTGLPDIAEVKVPDTNHLLPPEADIKTTDKPAKLGQTVYFANYETTRYDQARDPFQPDLSANAMRLKLYKPAIFGGVVIGTWESDYVIAEGLKTYDESDKYGRPGESGGPVFDAKGRLIGISIKGPVNNALYQTEDEIGRAYDVNLDGIPLGKKISWEIVQPVTSRLIGQMSRQLANAPNCVNIRHSRYLAHKNDSGIRR